MEYTSDLTGGLTYFASSEFSTMYVKAYAFDNTESSIWYSNGNTPQHVGVDFGVGNEKKIAKLRLLCNPSRPRYFTLQGSNDFVEWANVYSGERANDVLWQEFTFANSTAYRYYRVLVTGAMFTGSNVNFSEIEMMEEIPSVEEYEPIGTYTTSAIDASTLPTDPRLRWTAATPTGTTVIIKTAFTDGSPPIEGDWETQAFEEIITNLPADPTGLYLFIQVVLETTDPLATPTLMSLSLYGIENTTSFGRVLSTGVDGKIAALRGWKNVFVSEKDQGIVCAYIKNGVIYYRCYAQQPDSEPTSWEFERLVPNGPSPAQDIGLFRTNDYRLGFVIESAGEIWLGITPRNWAGLAVELERFTDHELRWVGTSFTPFFVESFNQSLVEIFNHKPILGKLRLNAGDETTLDTFPTVQGGMRTGDTSFYIEFSHDILVWDVPGFLTHGLSSEYTLLSVTVVGNRLYIETAEVTDELGFACFLQDYMVEGVITPSCYNFVLAVGFNVQGSLPVYEETFTPETTLEVGITNYLVSCTGLTNNEETLTYQANDIALLGINFTVLVVNTDPI